MAPRDPERDPRFRVTTKAQLVLSETALLMAAILMVVKQTQNSALHLTMKSPGKVSRETREKIAEIEVAAKV